MTHRWQRGGALRQFDHRLYGARMFAPVAVPSYTIANSLRFNSADSAYLSRTPGGAGNRKTWTWSGWVKRAALGGYDAVFNGGATVSDTGWAGVWFDGANNTLRFGTGATTWRTTTQVFRDTSAWYHLVIAFDTTQATAADRIKIYVNGSQVTSFGTSNNPTQNTDYGINQAAAHGLGYQTAAVGLAYADFYLAEVHFVDGTALTPSSFGQTDSITGQWVPKQVTGVTYGTNGFWLSFANNASTTTIGYDDAGGAAGAGAGSNDWTANNFSVTAGVGNDSLTDTPTNNFCVMNAVYKNLTLANGSLDATSGANTSGQLGFGTLFPTSGTWYFEFSPSATYTYSYLGVGNWGELTNSVGYPGNSANVVGLEVGSGIVYRNNASQGTYTGLSAGDIGMIAWDCASGKVWIGRNGTWFNSGDPAAGTGQVATIPSPGAIGPILAHYQSSGTISFNFGQRAFSYTPPTGFQALCTSNLTHPGSSTPKTGSFIGNANADGPFVWLGYPPDKSGTCTINGNAITWGTHADALANGFKVRTSSSSYNTAGSNTYSIAIIEAASFARNAKAQVNP